MKDKSTVKKLYPREELLRKIARAKSNGELFDYFDALLCVKNSSELSEFTDAIKVTDFVDCLGDDIAAEQALRLLHETWGEFDRVTDLISQSDPHLSVVPQEKIPLHSSTPDENRSAPSSELVGAIHELARHTFEWEEYAKGIVEEHGYLNLPACTAVFGLGLVEGIEEAIGFDPYSAVDDVIKNIDSMLKGIGSKQTVPVNTFHIRRQVKDDLLTVIKKLERLWQLAETAALRKLSSAGTTPTVDAFRRLGDTVFRFNRSAVSLIFDDGDSLFEEISHTTELRSRLSTVDANLESETGIDEKTEAMEDFLQSLIEGFSSEFDSIGLSAAATRLLAKGVMFNNITAFNTRDQPVDREALWQNLLSVSPVLFVGFRHTLFDYWERYARPAAFDLSSVSLAAFVGRHGTDPSLIDQEVNIEEVFAEVGLRLLPCSTRCLAELDSRIGVVDDDGCEFVRESLYFAIQLDLIELTRASKSRDSFFPFKDLSALSNLGGLFKVPGTHHRISWLSAFACLLEEDAHALQRENRWQEYRKAIYHISRDGHLQVAVLVYLYYLIWRSGVVLGAAQEEWKFAVNELSPFGPWAELIEVEGLLPSESAQIVRKVKHHIASIFRSRGVDFLTCAALELAGAETLNPSAKVLPFGPLRLPFDQFIRRRLTTIVGDSQWSELTSEVQNGLISVEKVFEALVGHGAESDSSGLWLSHYQTILEKQFFDVFSDWQTNANLQIRVQSIYQDLYKNSTYPKLLSFAALLRIIEKAGKSGDKVLVDWCRANSVALGDLATGPLLSFILKEMIPQRNITIHRGESSFEKAQAIRSWMLRNIHSVCAALGTTVRSQ